MGKGRGEQRRERERGRGRMGMKEKLLRVKERRPVWARLGGTLLSCLRSVILTSFPDKQISMLEKDIMI